MKPSFSIRAIFSLVLVGICAIIALDQPETPFVVTETPAVVPPSPQPSPKPKPAPAPIGEPAEVVCTFRCANCRRAPSLLYHEGDTLPLWATCKNCGRPMPRTDPKLNERESPKSAWGCPCGGNCQCEFGQCGGQYCPTNRSAAPPKTSYLPARRALACRT